MINKNKNEFQVIFYRDKNKNCRYIDFLNSLDIKIRAKVMMTVGILEEKGIDLKEPFTKLLDDGIFELRTIYSKILLEVCFSFMLIKK